MTGFRLFRHPNGVQNQECSMSFDELKNLLIEYVGLLPRNCVARIRYYRPFVIFHMSGPDAHHGRRGKQVSIGGDDKSRRRYASDFRKCVRRSKRLIGGSRLARIFVNLAPTFGASGLTAL